MGKQLMLDHTRSVLHNLEELYTFLTAVVEDSTEGPESVCSGTFCPWEGSSGTARGFGEGRTKIWSPIRRLLTPTHAYFQGKRK